MPANVNPIFIKTPQNPQGRATVANAARDGTGTLADLCVAGPNGAFYAGFRVQAEVTTTTGFIRVFVQKGGAGNFELKWEIAVPAVVPAVGVTAAWSYEIYPQGGIMLGANSVVKFSTEKAEAFSGHLEGGGDY
jgi:hypothetical protein